MSDQGERQEPRSRDQKDWWGELYDAGAPDTGRSAADDTIDDRFASVTGTMGGAGERLVVPGEPGAEEPGAGETLVPEEPVVLEEPVAVKEPVVPEQREPEEAAVPEPEGFGPWPEGPVATEPPAAAEAVPPPARVQPGELPAADFAALSSLAPDTVLDGARHGDLHLRAVSVRGDTARHAGEPRRDALLTARFGTGEKALLLVAVATGTGAAPEAQRAAREVCHAIGEAIGRSQERLAEDLLAGRRSALKGGLKRLTDRSHGQLRAQAAALGLGPSQHRADLRALLLPAAPDCATRLFFGSGPGGLFRLRDGVWQDIEPRPAEVPPPAEPPGEADAAETDDRSGPRTRPTMKLGIATPPPPGLPQPEPFRFRASVARPGDVLLLCGAGLAEPLRGEAEFANGLAARWLSRPEAPDLAEFLAELQTPVEGYGDDRTAAAVWEG